MARLRNSHERSDATYACETDAATQCTVRSSVRLAAVDWAMPAYGNVLILLAELAVLRVATYYALRIRLR